MTDHTIILAAGDEELTDAERAWIAARNVASIEAVPAAVWDAMDYGEHNRSWALHWARNGADCYAYRNAAGWQLWLDGERVELERAEGGDA